MTLALVPSDEGGNVNAAIGERVLLLIRRTKGMTQKRLAGALGITDSVLSKKIKGNSGWTAEYLDIAARELRVPVGALFGEAPLRATRKLYTAGDLNPEPADSSRIGRVLPFRHKRGGRRIAKPLIIPALVVAATPKYDSSAA